jgi:hypothetical protein
MTDYFLSRDKPFSRRALAVLIGVLESLTEATPSRQGHTHLRNLYTTLHPPGWEGSPYNSLAELSEADRDELHWWRKKCCSMIQNDDAEPPIMGLLFLLSGMVAAQAPEARSSILTRQN